MKNFALLGYPLSHSFSKKYFSQKFIDLGIAHNHNYELLELENVDNLLEQIAKTENMVGLNVTIPHKLNVIPLLAEIDPAANRIGAVNVIKVLPNNKLKGYNTDYYGFKTSLESFVTGRTTELKALVLGNGGAAKAVCVALEDMRIPYQLVSRKHSDKAINYDEANQILANHKLIINCTPLGTFPNIENCPDIDFSQIDSSFYFYDLVYNPEVTPFLNKAEEKGAKIKNGYEMLVLQAEKSWEIWNS